MWLVTTALESVEIAPRVAELSSGLGSRDQLLSALEEATRDGRSKMLAVFALDGFRNFEEQCGRREAEALLSRLAERLEQDVNHGASWYRPRHGEFALIHDAADPDLDAILRRAAAALREPELAVPIAAAYGSALVPDEAAEPIDALRLADTRLSAAQPDRPRRDRRAQARPGDRREPAPAPPAGDPLAAIHSELIEASASASRMRRVEQLLDIGRTLTSLADAGRIEDGGIGTLAGKPRDAARIPILMKELGLKLAALSALDGPEVSETAKLLAAPGAPSSLTARVHDALDEIATALAAA